LIVCDMGVKAYKPHHDAIIKTLLSIPLAQAQSRQEVEAQMVTGIPEVGVRQFLLKSLYRDDNNQFKWRFNLPVIAREYPNIIQGITVRNTFPKPTLFLRGGNSNYVQDSDLESIRQFFPTAELESIAGAGHWLHVDKPEEFVLAVKRFLEK